MFLMVKMDLVPSKTFGAHKIVKSYNCNLGLQKFLRDFMKILPNFLWRARTPPFVDLVFT